VAVDLKSVRVVGQYRPVEAMGLAELEAIRLVLRGTSVLDWTRLHLEDAAAVDHFLHLNLFDPLDPHDERRLRDILTQAVDYLRNAFGYRVAEAVAHPDDIRDVFLYASGAKEPRRHRRIACVVLKVMHVVHHLEARELLFRTPVREVELGARVHRRVMAEARRMKELGFPIVAFQGNVKSRASLITKLIAKRDTVAAQIFDRVRYRIVTQRADQIPSVVWHLADTLFPFSFVVPGQSRCSILSFGEILARHPRRAALARELHAPLAAEARLRESSNEFSGAGYKVLNFVIDLPIRVDELLPADGLLSAELGRVVFSLVEFQLLDEATAHANERGESSHARYKRRQLQQVLRRLSRGLVVPSRAGSAPAPPRIVKPRPRGRGKE
jgi:uncharacterized protein (TIGR04552 family)